MSSAARLALAAEFGADFCLAIDATTREERLQAVLEQTDGRGADIVMEFAGVPGAFNEGLALARRGGRYLIVGQLGEGSTAVQPSLIVKKNLTVIGSFSGDARSYALALEFIEAHQHDFPFTSMMSGRYRLDEVNTALERMRRQEEVKPVTTII